MAKEYTSIEVQVEYGLDTIDEDRTVTVSLRDLFYVYVTLGEFVRFFHQPMHYPTLEAIERFLGNTDAGAYHLLKECYCHRLHGVWPEDIAQEFTDGRYDNPVPPYYFEPAEDVP